MKLFSRQHEPATAAVSPDGPARIFVDGGYVPDTVSVAAGEPARRIFHRRDGSSGGEEVVFPDQGVRAALALHKDVVVELPPSDPGEYEFRCGMAMLRGRLFVR